MEKELIIVLKELGIEGIQAFYFYTILDYLTVWTIIALVAWGARTVWKHENQSDRWK